MTSENASILDMRMSQAVLQCPILSTCLTVAFGDGDRPSGAAAATSAAIGRSGVSLVVVVAAVRAAADSIGR